MSNKIKLSCIWLSLVLFLFSCGRPHNQFLHEEMAMSYQPKYSSGFDIKESVDSLVKVITIYNPWQGAKNVSSEFFLIKDNEDKKNWNELSKNNIIRGQADRIICMSSTHIAMLDALGAVDKIVGVSGMPYITNSYIQSHKNTIPDIGYEGNIDYEKIVAVKPDLVLLFSVNGASSMEAKLMELGIPYIYIGDYLEEDPLGKAEWIILLGELIGKKDIGLDKFNKIVDRYNTLKECISSKDLSAPKVMVNAPFLDSWFMPSSKSYVAKMIEDAGGKYIYNKNNGNVSLPLDLEEALGLVNEADFWINIGTVNSMEELNRELSKFSDAKCVKEGNVYNNNLKTTKEGGNDCYESGVVNPDLVLRDMIKIFHPDLIEEDFSYYHQLN